MFLSNQGFLAPIDDKAYVLSQQSRHNKIANIQESSCICIWGQQLMPIVEDYVK